jgi:hypothetical protein
MATPARRILVGFGIALPIVAASLGWYWFRHSMAPAASFAVNEPGLPQHVLIATQGSAFKDAIVRGVVERLEQRPLYIQVVDVTGLASIDERDWDAIVVLHTWQLEQPQPDAAAFIARANDRRKVIVLSTSGAGTQKIAGIDAISAASQMTDVASRVAELVARIDSELAH